ncbi:hypothetical protein BH09MYX1_BH09MYX1_25310 [soil metagenome]
MWRSCFAEIATRNDRSRVRSGMRIHLALAVVVIACNGSGDPRAAAPAASATPRQTTTDAGASAPTPDAGDDARPPQPTTPTTVVIRLERTPCLGTCPAYTVLIREDGSFLFGGWYPKKGCASGTLAPADLDALLAMAKAMSYPTLKNAYAVRATDLPSADTEVTLEGKTKKVHHYGYSGDPVEKTLTKFEEAIDTAIGSKKILSGELAQCNGQSPYPNVP